MRPVSKTPWIKIYLGVGSNVGNRSAHIQSAIFKLREEEGIRILKSSTLYETEPVGLKEQGCFLNSVTEGETILSPREFFETLKAVEKRVGRIEREKWGPREIDLDLLSYGERIIEEETLTVPHPRMHERDFVLVPLSEISPAWIHPKLKKNVKELLSECNPFDASHPKPYRVEVVGEAR